MGRSKKQQNREVKPSKFKTTLCQFFVKGEGCPFGDTCAFAHGEDELRDEATNYQQAAVLRDLNHAAAAASDAPPPVFTPATAPVLPNPPPLYDVIIAKPQSSWGTPSTSGEQGCGGAMTSWSSASSVSGREYDVFNYCIPSLGDGL